MKNNSTIRKDERTALKMGLAASQARLLTITARLADNELRSQTINNAKMRLATQSSQASDEYVSALNNAQLMFSNTDINGLARSQALTFNNLISYSQYNNQYGLVNSAGLLLVSEQDAENYKIAGGDLDKFLGLYGLTWDTTFFNDTTGLAKADSTELSSKIAQFYGTRDNTVENHNYYDLGYLFEGMTNAELEDLCNRAKSEEASVERMNYDIIAKAYYNQLDKLYDAVIPDIRRTVLGDSNSGLDEDTISHGLGLYAGQYPNGVSETKVEDHLINGTGALYTDSGSELTPNGTQYCLETLHNSPLSLLTDEAYNEIKTWVLSLTDDLNSDRAGFMDNEWSYNAPTANSGTYAAWDYTNNCIVTKTASSGDLGYSFNIAGLDITIDSKKVSDGFVWKNTDASPVVYKKTSTNTAPTDPGNWVFVQEVYKIGSTKQTSIEGTSDGAPNGLGPANYTNLPDVSGYHLSDFMSPNIDSTLTDLANGMKAVVSDSGDPTDCIYRYINTTGTDGDGSLVRVPLDDSREKIYELLAIEYFARVLDCAGNINWQNYATNNPGLSGVSTLFEAQKDFQLYDTKPITGTNEGKGSLESAVGQNASYLINFVALLQHVGGNYSAKTGVFDPTNSTDKGFGSDAFKSVLDTYLADLVLDVLGEPKYAWVDENDPNATQNADTKAQWYENLFNRMQRGYKVLENGLANSKEWIEYAFESGLVTMEQVDKSFNWVGLDYKTCANIYENSDNSDAVAKAEAKYNRAMNDIKQKDSMYDLQLKNIDTEHQSLQTEYDSVKGVMNKNIERTMKFDQSA